MKYFMKSLQSLGNYIGKNIPTLDFSLWLNYKKKNINKYYYRINVIIYYLNKDRFS